MTFDELKQTDYRNPTVALFYGINCKPCELLKPKVKRICEENGVRLEMFNGAAEIAACRELGLRSVPAVLTVFKGKASVVFTGDLDERLVKAKLEAAGVRMS